MQADVYEDALRYVTGDGRGQADAFREGTKVDNWDSTRDGLLQMLQQLQQDARGVPMLTDHKVSRTIDTFGLGRSLDALNNDELGETERAYLVACGLAYALKCVLNRAAELE